MTPEELAREPTPLTDEYVDAWDRVNGDTCTPIEKGAFRHGIDRLRSLEQRLRVAVRLLRILAEGSKGSVTANIQNADDARSFLALTEKHDEKG